MSEAPSLYRRHRPRTFADVVGSEHVVRTLSHAVERDAVHHAYLFVGSRGTGKTSMAKILAACLNCAGDPAHPRPGHPTTSPCGVCDSCVSIAAATSLDVIEMDAASNNSVDDIRELRENVAFAPVSGRHKVYILDEAHMLSPQAWNAFLKTLEEPPPRTVFVLATTEAQKILPTVVDRCQRFDFGRPTAAEVALVVRRVADAESVDIDEGAVALVARHATGSFRDALGTLEQLITYAGGERIEPADVLAVLGVADAEQLFAAVDAVVARDPAGALRAAAELAASGRDPGQVLRDLEVHARELLTVQILREVPAELRVTAERDARLAEQASRLHETDAVRLLDLVSGALEATANGAQPRIQLELVLIRAAAPELDPSSSALLARIERLEKGASSQGPSTSTVREFPKKDPGTAPQQEEAASEQPEAPAQETDPAPQPVPDGVAGAELEAEAEAIRTPPSPPRVNPDSPPATQSPERVAGEEPESLALQEEPTRLDLQQIAATWPAVVDQLRGANAMLAALMDRAAPVAVDDRELTLALPADAAFLKRKAEQEDHRRTAQEAIRGVTGVSVALRYELAEPGPDGTANGAEGSGSGLEPLSEDELVRRFIEEFDAQEIDDIDEGSDGPN